MKELKGALETKELLKSSMKEFIKNREISLQKASVRSIKVKKHSRYIPAQTKIAIRARSKDQCEFISPITNKRCHSKQALQFEHIKPYAKGGGNSLDNLKHHCAEHNRFTALREYGINKINRYLKL